MAFNSSALLPHLYDVQRNITYMEKYYGDRVLARTIEEPQSAIGQSPPAAPKSRIIGFLLRCADSLYQYSRMKKSIEDMKESRKGTATLYVVMITIIITLPLVVIGLVIFFQIRHMIQQNKKILEDATKTTVAALGTAIVATMESAQEHIDTKGLLMRYLEENARFLFYTLVALVVWTFFLSVTIIIYRRNKEVYDKAFQTEVLEESNHYIADVANMLSIKDFKGDMPANVVTNNTLMYHYFMKFRKPSDETNCDVNVIGCSSFSVASAPGGGCYEVKPKSANDEDDNGEDVEDKCCNLHKKDDVDVVKDCHLCSSVFNGQKYITPFHPGMQSDLWSYKLLRYLKQCDVPGQTGRIRNAMNYFKQLLMKRFDEQSYSMTLEDEKKFIKAISHVVTLPAAEVIDLAIGDLSRATPMDPSFKTAAECYSKGLNDDNVLVVYFDKATSTGYTLSAEQLANNYLVHDSNGFANGGILIRVSLLSDPHVVIVGNNRNQGYYDTYFRRDCSSSNTAMRGCTWAYIGNDPRRGVVSGTAKSGLDKWVPDYAELFKGSTSDTANSMGGTGNNMFGVSISVNALVKQKQPQRHSMLLDLLRDQLPRMLAEGFFVAESVMDNGWTLGEKEIEKILEEIQRRPFYRREWHVYGPMFKDILMATATQVISLRNKKKAASGDSSKEDDNTGMYVSHGRFVEVVGKMSKEEFMHDFMFNLDELRSTSEGLSTLYNKFDYSSRVHNDNQLVLNLVTAFGLIIAILVLGDFGYIAYKNMQETVVGIRNDKNRPPTWEQDIMSVKINFGMKVAIAIGAMITVFSMIQAFKQKTDDLFNYNKSILTKNGSAITNNSKELFDTLFDQIMGDQASANKPDDEVMFLKMLQVKGTAVDVEKIAGSMSKFEYQQFIDMLNAFDKCSTLFSTNQTMVPFPMLEVSLYTALIVFMLVILIALTFALNPYARIQSLRKQVRTKGKLNAREKVFMSELTFDCGNEIEKKKIDNLIKFVTIILLLILPLLFSISLAQSSANFLSSIYLSDYFAKSDCYSV